MNIEELENKIANTIPLNYEFNKENVIKFINKSDNYRNLLLKIINVTKHVSYEEFYNKLIKCFKIFYRDLNTKRPIHVLMNMKDYPYKSNHWVFLILRKNYPTLNFNKCHNLDDPNIMDGDSVIFLDDCIYSGTQTGNFFMNLNNTKKIEIFMLVLYISQRGYDLIMNKINENETLKIATIKWLKKELTLIKPLSFYLTDVEKEEAIKMFKEYYGYKSNESIEKFPIYFDHKLADRLSTFTEIYSGVTATSLNADIFNSSYSVEFYNLDIIPILNHCENVKIFNKIAPYCPSPVYKVESHENFLKSQHYKKNVKFAKSNKITYNSKQLNRSKDDLNIPIIRSKIEKFNKDPTLYNFKGYKISQDNYNKFKKYLELLKSNITILTNDITIINDLSFVNYKDMSLKQKIKNVFNNIENITNEIINNIKLLKNICSTMHIGGQKFDIITFLNFSDINNTYHKKGVEILKNINNIEEISRTYNNFNKNILYIQQDLNDIDENFFTIEFKKYYKEVFELFNIIINYE